MTEHVILVDQFDTELGFTEKLEAHFKGLLHRAFSIFVFDSQRRLLIQRRAAEKYHSGGLWSNSCCGHPRPGEELIDAATRRLQEEMGFSCFLRPAFQFIYRTAVDPDLVEHEVDHVLIGKFDGVPAPDPEEVSAIDWIGLELLKSDCIQRPDRYTHWLKTALDAEFWNEFETAQCENAI